MSKSKKVSKVNGKKSAVASTGKDHPITAKAERAGGTARVAGVSRTVARSRKLVEAGTTDVGQASYPGASPVSLGLAPEAGVGRRERDPRLPAVGTVLVKRDRGGQARCECTVEEGGFLYAGKLHRSLSGAATAAAADLKIKGRVNGYLFWGVIKASRPLKNPGEALRKIATRYEQHVAALLKTDAAPETRTEVRRELEAHAAHLTELLASLAA